MASSDVSKLVSFIEETDNGRFTTVNRITSLISQFVSKLVSFSEETDNGRFTKSTV